MLNKEIIREWVEDLRSPLYTKGIGAYKINDSCFCVLGLLMNRCDLNGKGKWGTYMSHHTFSYNDEVGVVALTTITGIPYYEFSSLIRYNDDDENFTFTRAAAYIEGLFLSE